MNVKKKEQEAKGSILESNDYNKQNLKKNNK